MATLGPYENSSTWSTLGDIGMWSRAREMFNIFDATDIIENDYGEVFDIIGKQLYNQTPNI